MKTDELKLRIVNFINGLIDKYLYNNDIITRIKNATAKFWVDQNIGKIDKILSIFQDEYGCIDTVKLKQYYSDALFKEGDFRVDIHSIIPQDMEYLKKILPQSIIIFTQDDLNKLLV